jgi:hypothetical protein
MASHRNNRMHKRINHRHPTGLRAPGIRNSHPRLVRSHLRDTSLKVLILMGVADMQHHGRRFPMPLRDRGNGLRRLPANMTCLKTTAIGRRHRSGEVRRVVMNHCVPISTILLMTSGNMAVVQPTIIPRPIANMTTKIMKSTSLAAGVD